MLRIAIFKTQQLQRGCMLHGYPKISSEERLARWIKRVHRRTPAHGRPMRMQVPARIQSDQKLPDAWVSLHADGTVIHISSNVQIGQST